METIIQRPRAIEWSPVIAGTILACAVSLVLMQFGHALGLSFTDMHSRTTVTTGSFMVFGLWTLWVQLSASIMGAYLAGRMLTHWDASHESELRDGAHGLLVWALSTVLTAIAVGAASYVATLAATHGVEAHSTIGEIEAKRLAIISGFSLAAISIVSAASAWIVASHAGDHRVRKVDVTKHVTFRRVVVR